jgi:hypothetical protein
MIRSGGNVIGGWKSSCGNDKRGAVVRGALTKGPHANEV